MYLSLKAKKTPKEHKNLLLLSIVVVTSFLYALVQSNNHVTLPTQTKVKERVLALVINPAPMKKEIVQKEIVKEEVVKKEIVKEQIIEKPKKIAKPIKKENVQKEIVKKEPTKEEHVEEVVEQKIVQEVEKPIFNEHAKESFIAGLYEELNRNKRYPKMAKRRKLEGVCEVSFTLNKDGRLKDIFLKEACGHSILDKAALKVVTSIEFYKPIPDNVSLSSLHLNIPIKYTRN